jgi:hypothetical protein
MSTEQETAAGLRECPFCGEAPHRYDGESDYPGELVWCVNDKCPIFGNRVDLPEWNARALGELERELADALERIAGDYIPDRPEDAALALSEMREAVSELCDRAREAGQ